MQYAPYTPYKPMPKPLPRVKAKAKAKRVRFSRVVTVIEIPRDLKPHVEANGVPPLPRSSTRRPISDAEMRLRLRLRRAK